MAEATVVALIGESTEPGSVRSRMALAPHVLFITPWGIGGGRRLSERVWPPL